MRQSVLFEVSQREREPVVDADERGRPFGESLDQPLSDAPTSPIFARTQWRSDFLRGGQTVGCIDAQTLKAKRWASLRRNG